MMGTCGVRMTGYSGSPSEIALNRSRRMSRKRVSSMEFSGLNIAGKGAVGNCPSSHASTAGSIPASLLSALDWSGTRALQWRPRDILHVKKPCPHGAHFAEMADEVWPHRTQLGGRRVEPHVAAVGFSHEGPEPVGAYGHIVAA